MFDVTVDASQVAKWAAGLGEARRQLPFAMALGATWTAQRVKPAERAEMQRIFDQPTPYTLNSVFMKPATPKKPEAVVWLKDEKQDRGGAPAAQYLGPQVFGGPRRKKRSERRLGYFITLPESKGFGPARIAMKRDQYGNVHRGEMIRLLQELGVLEEKSKKKKKRKPRGYFMVRPGTNRRGQHLKPGIYRRRSDGKLDLIFVITRSAPTYKPIFHFHAVAQRIVDQHFLYDLGRALQYALATAA